jgi:hypothetical protein
LEADVSCNFCHGVNQGRVCEACLNATRAAMFFPPLHIEDGGHNFNGGIAFPIEAEDEPAEGEDWFFKFTVFIVAVFMACLAGAAIAIFSAG